MHNGITGNVKADEQAKEGTQQQQDENPVGYMEIKVMIKYLHNTTQKEDSYHQLIGSEQTTIFRPRTGHNRLNKHLHSYKGRTINYVSLRRGRAKHRTPSAEVQVTPGT